MKQEDWQHKHGQVITQLQYLRFQEKKIGIYFLNLIAMKSVPGPTSVHQI